MEINDGNGNGEKDDGGTVMEIMTVTLVVTYGKNTRYCKRLGGILHVCIHQTCFDCLELFKVT